MHQDPDGRPLSITYLHQYLDYADSWRMAQMFGFVRGLVAAGHQVTVVGACRKNDPNEPDWWTAGDYDGFKVYWVAVQYSPPMTRHLSARARRRLHKQMAGLAMQHPADIVLATRAPAAITYPAVRLAERLRVPLVWMERDVWPAAPAATTALRASVERAAARYLDRYAYRHAAAVVAPSASLQDYVVRAGCPADKAHVIPDICDVEFFTAEPGSGLAFRSSHPWLGARPLVVHAGRLDAVSGADYFISLAAETARIDPEVRFLILGDGPRRAEVEFLAQQAGVYQHNLFLMRDLPRRDLPALLAAATVVAPLLPNAPAIWTNPADGFVHALAAGKPLAINFGDWQADTLRESGAGIALPPDDPESAARLLYTALKDESFLASASQAALQLAHTRFERSRVIAELSGVLQGAVAQQRKRAPTPK